MGCLKMGATRPDTDTRRFGTWMEHFVRMCVNNVGFPGPSWELLSPLLHLSNPTKASDTHRKSIHYPPDTHEPGTYTLTYSLIILTSMYLKNRQRLSALLWPIFNWKNICLAVHLTLLTQTVQVLGQETVTQHRKRQPSVLLSLTFCFHSNSSVKATFLFILLHMFLGYFCLVGKQYQRVSLFY